MQYYPQPQQNYNAYNNLAGMSYNGIPAGCSPYMQTIGQTNIVPFGYNGYNTGGGYYTGYYNNYNPYVIKQQQEMTMAQYREQQREQSSIMKKLYKCSCNYFGQEEDQSIVNKLSHINGIIEPDDISDFTFDEQQEYYRILRKEQELKQNQEIINNMQNNPDSVLPYNPLVNAYCTTYAKMSNDYQDKLKDMGFVEYFNTYAGQEYMEALINKSKRGNNNLRTLYNPDDYNSLLKRHKEGLFGNALNPDASIDDMEVRLPSVISEQTKQERRMRFMNAVLSNSPSSGVNMNG